jgi:vancomycin permeability regulator SanA
MVSRQSVDFGTIEFATMVPSHDKDAGNFLAKLVELAETCNVEVSGANDRFTTFAPTRQNTARTIAVADLYLKVLREPAWLDGIVKRALPNEVYLERIQGALSMGDLQ